MSDKRDVTGVWYGRYEAGHWDEKNGFIATFEEAGGAFDGVITERDDDGIRIRRAVVSGHRTGDRVHFVKQYDGSCDFFHAVTYGGSMDEEGTEISGAWVVPGGHGRFVMEREKFSEEELEAEEEVELIEPVLR